MNIGLLSILHTQIFDFHRELASGYAAALKNAIELHVEGTDKKQNYFLSAKRGMDDKLYVGNIHRIENHLYWNDEELADDDQIVNVVWVDGPITRDGGACSYGTKDMRDQVMYANTIPQVVGHLFYINTPGGESSARNDYEMMINDCREKGKSTVAFVDGLCASSGVNLASRCDRVIVMNPRDEFGCIGSMAAFWATPDGAISKDGERYVEIVGKDCPAKNDWYREAAQGEYTKLQAMLDKSTDEFHQSVRENRPLVEDWMLTGEVFEAQQLIPALVDEIGDYNRAIECVFQLADQTLPAARFAVPRPDANAPGTVADPNEPEEMAKLNEQQKAAVATSKGDLMMAENGHVTTEAQGFFGPETVEVATPKNNGNMEKDELMAAEAEAAQAAAQETAEQAASPTPGPSPEGEGSEAASPTPGPSPEGEGSEAEAEDQPAAEEAATEQPAADATGTVAEEAAGEEQEATEQPAADATGTVAEEAAGEEQAATEQPAADAEGPVAMDAGVPEEAIAEAQAEIDRIAETLHNAETMIAEKNKELADKQEALDATAADLAKATDALAEKQTVIDTLTKEKEDGAAQLATLTAQLSEKDAAIQKLTKQVAELKAEVKELSEKPTPMVTAESGIPADNGTGEAPNVGGVKSEVTSDMSVEEIRAKLRAKDEKSKTYRH